MIIRIQTKMTISIYFLIELYCSQVHYVPAANVFRFLDVGSEKISRFNGVPCTFSFGCHYPVMMG